jgi:hypothetical protein
MPTSYCLAALDVASMYFQVMDTMKGMKLITSKLLKKYVPLIYKMFAVVFKCTDTIVSLHKSKEEAEQSLLKSIKIELNAITSLYVNNDKFNVLDKFKDAVEFIMYDHKKCDVTFKDLDDFT